MKAPGKAASVMIADDERPARRRIAELVRRHPEIAVVGEAANGLEAVEIVRAERPALVFLDVQMPELDGFGVIAQVGPASMPAVVFVTAYDRYAIEAFDVNAVDYLLKPFSDERFEQALAKALHHLGRPPVDLESRLRELLRRREPAQAAYLDRLVVKRGGGIQLMRTAEIDWIEADGVYVTVHAGRETFLHRTTLTELGRRLDPRSFVRIHRSTIVSIDRIARLAPHTHGDFDLLLVDGTRLRVSRSFRPSLEARLGQRL